MAYEAIVSRVLSVSDIPGSDRIKLAQIGSYQIIVGLDTAVGTVGLLFESGTQLSEQFASANDLVRRKDERGNPAGGYFEANRRVKAIKMRGARSEGFFCGLGALAFTGYDVYKLNEGDKFSELNGVSICNKYYTPATLRAMANGTYKQVRSNIMFPKHIETEQLKKCLNELKNGDLVHFSEKIHGSSGRYGLVLETKPLPGNKLTTWFRNLFKLPTTKSEWVKLVGTRNVVLQGDLADQPTSYYGDESFRYKAVEGLNLAKGEIVYGELVGWAGVDKPIMARQTITDKAVKLLLGDTITYTYGQVNGACKFYIYRICQANEDGKIVELSWFDVQRRALQLGFETVPHFETFIYDGDPDRLLKYVTSIIDNGVVLSTLDNTHLMEGVVLRVESNRGTDWYKAKSTDFLIAEGILREKEDFVDSEECA